MEDAPDDLGGDPACWAGLVCEHCGRIVDRRSPHRCVRAAALDRIEPGAATSGAVWSLVGDRQLDANLVVLAPGGAIAEHVNTEVDVLVIVLGGSGRATVDGAVHLLAQHDLLFVPKGAARQLVAAEDGLRYVSVHAARGRLTIRS